MMLKAKHGWSNNSFNDLLCLLDFLLPNSNFVSKNTYEANKITIENMQSTRTGQTVAQSL
jgi:hypothetical protein